MDQMKIGTSAGITAFYNKDYYYALCVPREVDGYTSEAVKLTVEPAESITLEIITGMDTYQ